MQLTTAARRQRGFTLVELMVTLALLALLLFAVVPEMGSWQRNMQIRGTAESLQSGLQRARTEAINRNRQVRFSLVKLGDVNKMDDSCALSVNGASWVVSLDDPAGKCGAALSPTDAPRILVAQAGGTSGTKTTVTASGDVSAGPAWAVVFDNYGRLAGNARTIQQIDVTAGTGVNGEARPLRLVLSTSGGVRMCDPAVTATADPRKC